MILSRQYANFRLVLAALVIALGFLAELPAAQAQSVAAAYTTGYRYDAMRRLVGEISPSATAGGTSGPYIAVRYTYDADGQLIASEKGYLSSWQDQTILPANWTGFTVTRMTSVAYDPAGNKLSEAVTSGGTTYGVTQYAYDVNDRVTCTTVRLNLTSPPADACTLGTAGSQGNDRITKNVYDAAGQVVQVRKAVGTAREEAYATYSYTLNGKQQYVIDANGNKAQLTWDGYDRQSQWIFPSPTALSSTAIASFNAATPANALTLAGSVNTADYEQYGYDANGNRTSLKKRDGSTLTYTFDALNRMTVKTVLSRANLPATYSRSVFYGYDLRGLMTSANFDSATGEGLSTIYDKAGRIASSTIAMNNVPRQLTYQYDANGNRTQVTLPGALSGPYATYAYDGLNRALAVTGNASDWTHTYSYTPDGNLTTDAVGMNQGDSSYATTGYSRDAIGRLATLSRSLTGTSSYNIASNYTYNNASQIASESRNNDTYAFTARQNLNRTFTANGLNQYAAVSTIGQCYDANGNMTADGTSVYLYDIENRLVEKHVQGTGNTNCAALSYSGTPQATLRYDPMGRLYETSAGNNTAITRFLIDGDALVGEYDISGNQLRTYFHGADLKADDPLAWYEIGQGQGGKGSAHLLYANQQGSIVLAADIYGSSSSTSQFKYDEYGTPQMTSGIPGATQIAAAYGARFLYTGQVLIPELGMYYYKARIYSPVLGRFMQVDPIGYKDQNNLYAYVANDPVDHTDPTGTTCTTSGSTITCVVQIKGSGENGKITKQDRAAAQKLANNYLKAAVRADAAARAGQTVTVKPMAGSGLKSFSVPAREIRDNLFNRTYTLDRNAKGGDAGMTTGSNGAMTTGSTIYRGAADQTNRWQQEAFIHEAIHGSLSEGLGMGGYTTRLGEQPWADRHQVPYNDAADQILGR